jgi:rRNA maturation protein Nop10
MKNARFAIIPTLDPHPPKFSMEDKYIRYRIEEKYLNKD